VIVLLIDDDPAIRLIATAALEGDGHRVTPAATAQQGLERLSVELPDAILLDVMLPDGNGIELLGEIRRIAGCETLPVIFLTGRDDAEMIARLDASSALGRITKPFDPTRLSEEVAHCLSG
jgi:DNA-binding response OmpR family regulator